MRALSRVKANICKSGHITQGYDEALMLSRRFCRILVVFALAGGCQTDRQPDEATTVQASLGEDPATLSVSWVAPAEGQALSSAASLAVNVTAAAGVDRVEFWSDPGASPMPGSAGSLLNGLRR